MGRHSKAQFPTVARIDGHRTDSTLDRNVGLNYLYHFYTSSEIQSTYLDLFKEYRWFMEGKKG